MPPAAAAVAGLAGAVIGGVQKKKAEKKAQQFAEEQERRAQEEARRREEIIAERAYLTPEEEKRERRYMELEARRLPILEERARMTGAELVEPTLQPQLELVRQMINAEANRRGVFGGLPEGGIRFEQLGRAGVELAIKSAQEQMAAQQQARAELADFLRTGQTLSAGARARQAETAMGGQQLGAGITGQAAQRRADITTDVLGAQMQSGAELASMGGRLLGGSLSSLSSEVSPLTRLSQRTRGLTWDYASPSEY